ncbi:hypothetical protein RSAG8_07118, partial [Rhizoctonia solani AG-8 WAC10335]
MRREDGCHRPAEITMGTRGYLAYHYSVRIPRWLPVGLGAHGQRFADRVPRDPSAFNGTN